MQLTTIPQEQLRRGKIIALVANRYIVQVGKGTINASGQGFAIGDTVVVSKINGVFQIISKFNAISSVYKEVFIRS
jgi:hypothetical protein